MKDDQKLPRELVWDGAHVSEVALTAIGDGQEAIVEANAVAHVDSCEWCAGRLGRIALLSAAVGQAVAATRPASASSPVRVKSAAPRPWGALAAGLLVAVLAALPMLQHFERWLSYALAFATRGVPVLARGGVALATSDAVTRALPVATLAASALLVVMGCAIARARSRASEGSVS
jgi:hypothetical protein